MRFYLLYILLLISLLGFSQKRNAGYIIVGDSSIYILTFKTDSTVIKSKYIVGGVVWGQTQREYKYQKSNDSVIIKNFYKNEIFPKIFTVSNRVLIDKKNKQIGFSDKYYKKQRRIKVFLNGVSLSGKELKNFIIKTNYLETFTLSRLSKYDAYQKYGYKSLKRSIFEIKKNKN